MRLVGPHTLWVDQPAEVSVSFDVRNVGLRDVKPCASGCALLDVLLFLSRDSQWNPSQDLRLQTPNNVMSQGESDAGKQVKSYFRGNTIELF